MKFQLLFLFIFVIIITIYIALNGKNTSHLPPKPIPIQTKPKQLPKQKPRPHPPRDLLLPIVPKTNPIDLVKQNVLNTISTKISENKIIDTKVENKKIQDNMLELNNLAKYLPKDLPKDLSNTTLKSALKSPGFVSKSKVKFNPVVTKQFIDMNEPTGAPIVLANEKIQLAK